MVATLTASYFLLTADYGPEPNVLDPVCILSIFTSYYLVLFFSFSFLLIIILFFLYYYHLLLLHSCFLHCSVTWVLLWPQMYVSTHRSREVVSVKA